MTRRTVVLPSPYLGPAAYGPLADELGANVATLPAEPFTAAAVMAAFAAQVSDADLVVAHSNAGLYAAALGRPTVFVDAALPGATGGRTPLAPPSLADGVAALADSGLLPRWTRWWPRPDLGKVLPDPWFDRVDSSAPRVPAAYLTDVLDVPVDWAAAAAAAYLAFGDTYADELALATSLGWPTARLEGGHLLLLTEPAVVSRAVEAFAVA